MNLCHGQIASFEKVEYGSRHANFLPLTQFKRLGVHMFTLPPGESTSLPHAESHEEEFVYVVRGEVDVWLNGWIYSLRAGHAVGFPAGTGLAHCFLNNSTADVELFVAGEQTKRENKCHFPLHPEKAKDAIWWSQPPPQPGRGPHLGVPGPVLDHERGRTPHAAIVHFDDLVWRGGFHYPGDSEVFGQSRRFSDVLGLKVLGVGIEQLPPGHRSSFPHAHTHEEEFVLPLEGQLTLWLNGETCTIEPGDVAAFTPGTGVSHTLINENSHPVLYLMLGEVTDFPEEKIVYPMNELRSEECRQKGWLWQNPPAAKMGLHNGRPERPPPGRLSLRLVKKSDFDEVLSIYRRSPDYFDRVEGVAPTIELVQSHYENAPSRTGPGYRKELLFCDLDGVSVGVVEIFKDHPEPGAGYVGQLLLVESHFGKGLGRRFYQLIEDYMKRVFSCERLRLGVSEDNRVDGFWSKCGYALNGNQYVWKGEGKSNIVREWEKRI